LKPGGVARFVTPDLERLVKAVNDPAALERDIELFRGTFAPLPIGQKYPAFSGVDYINVMFREWGH
jgi:hypothetical protein